MPPLHSGPGHALAALLEAAFRRIEQERMAGIAILNPALRVEVLGGSSWQECWLAVLITPWCMNLILLPAKDEDSSVGHERLFYRFPAGDFAFLRGREPEIGEYHSCALFSPMSQFADQESVRAVAEAALAALFAPARTSPKERTGRDGRSPAEARLSRRGFLSGGLSGR